MTAQRFQRATARSKQRGVGMAIALAVIAVLAAIAVAIALSNKSGSTKTDLETAKVMAQTIIARGNDLTSAVNRMAPDFDLTQLTIATTATAPAWGLYDPQYGVAQQVLIPGKAFNAGADSDFLYDAFGGNFKASGSVDGAWIFVNDLKLPVCQTIERLLHNTSMTATPASHTIGAIAPNSEGCVLLGTSYTYYRQVG